MSNTCCQLFLFLKNYLFIFGCARSSLLHKLFSSRIEQRLLSKLQCMSFSWQWLLFLLARGHVGFSSCGTLVLEHRLSSCGARAQLLYGRWDLSGSGMEPVSPALAGKFFTTESSGKPTLNLLNTITTKQGNTLVWEKASVHKNRRSMKGAYSRQPPPGYLSLWITLSFFMSSLSTHLHALCFLTVAKL